MRQVDEIKFSLPPTEWRRLVVCTVAAAAHCRGQRGRFRPGQKSRHAGESQNAYSLCELVHYPIVVWNEKNRRTINEMLHREHPCIAC